MDIEFDHKGDPIGGIITNCESISILRLNALSAR